MKKHKIKFYKLKFFEMRFIILFSSIQFRGAEIISVRVLKHITYFQSTQKKNRTSNKLTEIMCYQFCLLIKFVFFLSDKIVGFIRSLICCDTYWLFVYLFIACNLCTFWSYICITWCLEFRDLSVWSTGNKIFC